MSLIEDITNAGLKASALIVISLGVITGLNFYSHHNVSYQTDTKKVFQKADGIISYTELVVHKDSKEIIRNSIIKRREYFDENNNDHIDRFVEWSSPLSRGPPLKKLEKEDFLEDFVTYRKANNDFQKQLKRFNLYQE